LRIDPKLLITSNLIILTHHNPGRKPHDNQTDDSSCSSFLDICVPDTPDPLPPPETPITGVPASPRHRVAASLSLALERRVDLGVIKRGDASLGLLLLHQRAQTSGDEILIRLVALRRQRRHLADIETLDALNVLHSLHPLNPLDALQTFDAHSDVLETRVNRHSRTEVRHRGVRPEGIGRARAGGPHTDADTGGDIVVLASPLLLGLTGLGKGVGTGPTDSTAVQVEAELALELRNVRVIGSQPGGLGLAASLDKVIPRALLASLCAIVARRAHTVTLELASAAEVAREGCR
jgi:hypothetical protein